MEEFLCKKDIKKSYYYSNFIKGNTYYGFLEKYKYYDVMRIYHYGSEYFTDFNIHNFRETFYSKSEMRKIKLEKIYENSTM